MQHVLLRYCLDACRLVHFLREIEEAPLNERGGQGCDMHQVNGVGSLRARINNRPNLVPRDATTPLRRTERQGPRGDTSRPKSSSSPMLPRSSQRYWIPGGCGSATPGLARSNCRSRVVSRPTVWGPPRMGDGSEPLRRYQRSPMQRLWSR